jgi:uncharacterized protein (TIGR02246 family)
VSDSDRIQALEDREAIRELYARWAYCDYEKDGRGWSELFVEDGTYINPRGVEFAGRAAIEQNLVDRNAARPAEWRVVHIFGPVVIQLHGDTAEAYANYVACARQAADGPWSIGASGRHHARLVRRGGGWLFSEYRIVNPPEAAG